MVSICLYIPYANEIMEYNLSEETDKVFMIFIKNWISKSHIYIYLVCTLKNCTNTRKKGSKMTIKHIFLNRAWHRPNEFESSPWGLAHEQSEEQWSLMQFPESSNGKKKSKWITVREQQSH